MQLPTYSHEWYMRQEQDNIKFREKQKPEEATWKFLEWMANQVRSIVAHQGWYDACGQGTK